MSNERKGLRGVVLTEDKMTERFVRHLLVAHGFEKRSFYFRMAPPGRGAAEPWVLLQYPAEVKNLRAKIHQRLCLVVFRDGDAVGVDGRKAQFEEALHQAELALRASTERIATLVPTWAIENWLLDLLDEPNINEEQKPSREGGPIWKQVFERIYGSDVRRALEDAVSRWETASARLPSLNDGRVEFARIEQ